VEASRLEFPEATLREWQEVVDLVARLTGVRAALIMRARESEDWIQVLVASQTAANPFHPGETDTLHGSGLYCERVLKTRQVLCVPDALASPEWDHNPDLERGMVSYLGLPILQPDGRAFGTICILDDRARPPDPVAVDLLHKMRDLVQGQLHLQERLRLQTLLADNALLRRLIDGLPTGVACSTLPPDSRIIYLNRHFTDTFGYALEELPTMEAWASRVSRVEGQPMESFAAWLAGVEAVQAGDGRLPRLEHLFLTKDGEARRVLVNATVLEDLLVASLVDITDLRRSESELRASEQRHRLLADQAVDVLWTLDLTTRRLTYASPSFQTLKGYTPEEARHLELEDLIAPESMPIVQAALAEVQARVGSGLPVAFKPQEILEKHRDGSTFWTEMTATGMHDDEGRFLGLLGITRDITRRKEAEAGLRHALEEKEKAVAELSEALERVQTLSGLLPICSHCKKVRDDAGYWQRIERYIEQRTEATFTHGLCPTCIQGLYPGLASDMLAED